MSNELFASTFVPVDQIFAKYIWYRNSPIYGPDKNGFYWAAIGAQGDGSDRGALAKQNEAKPEWNIVGGIAYLFVDWFDKQMLPVAVELSDPMGVQLADPKSKALEDAVMQKQMEEQLMEDQEKEDILADDRKRHEQQADRERWAQENP